MIELDNYFHGQMSSNKRKSDAATGDPAFERWVARQLHKIYDDVLAEEVPEELLRVVDRATGKPATGPGSGNGAAGPVHTTRPTKAKRDRR